MLWIFENKFYYSVGFFLFHLDLFVSFRYWMIPRFYFWVRGIVTGVKRYKHLTVLTYAGMGKENTLILFVVKGLIQETDGPE